MNWRSFKRYFIKTDYDQLDAAALERVKKRKLVVLRSLNSPEYIANQFTRYAFNESSLFDALTVLEGLTVQDLQEVAGLLLSEEK